MKVWPEPEEPPDWYNLHTDDSRYDAAYGQRHGYTVIDVAAATLARWQQALAAAQDAVAEIGAAIDAAATPDNRQGQ